MVAEDFMQATWTLLFAFRASIGAQANPVSNNLFIIDHRVEYRCIA